VIVPAGGGVAGDRGDDRRRVEAAVVPERPVLGGRRRVEHELRDLVEGDDPALLALEATELDRPRPVVDDRRLGEGQRAERRRVRQVFGQGTDRCRRPDRRQPGEEARPDRERGERRDEDRRGTAAPRRRALPWPAEDGPAVGDLLAGNPNRGRPADRSRSGHGALLWDSLVHAVRIG
jgi:hypothetical protein